LTKEEPVRFWVTLGSWSRYSATLSPVYMLIAERYPATLVIF